MMVNGPLEIYSTVIGAKLYDAIFNILRSSGLVFLPLIGIFFANVTSAYETPFETGAETSMRRVAVQFFVLVFAIMLFVAPTHKLDVSEISYRPVCASSAVTSTFGDTGTTYDDAFADFSYDSIRLPIGLVTVLDGTSGVTNAAIVSLPCKTDVQEIEHTIDTTRLPSSTAEEVKRFNTECYATAKAKFNTRKPDTREWQNIMNEYGGQTDLSWMGSHVLRSLYYNDMYPTSSVAGFPYNEFPYKYQDYNQKQGVQTPKWGFPTCGEWWSDTDYGLEGRLVDLVESHQPNDPHLGENSIVDKTQKWLAEAKTYTHLGSQVTPQDVIVQNLLYNTNSNAGYGENYNGWMEDTFGSGTNNINQFTEGVANTGQLVTAAGSKIDRAEIRQEIPIIQAILMALCLAFGPIILVLGGYRINVIFSYYFILSSVITMTFVENVIHYLELSLHASARYGLYALNNFAVMYNVFTKLYFYGPMLYLMLMSICGVTIGKSLDSVFGNSIAGSGSKTAKSLISTGAKFIK
jgi:hypothetical protein